MSKKETESPMSVDEQAKYLKQNQTYIKAEISAQQLRPGDTLKVYDNQASPDPKIKRWTEYRIMLGNTRMAVSRFEVEELTTD